MNREIIEMAGNEKEPKIEPTQAVSGITPGLPLLGFRNYWYPLIESRRVKKGPVSVRLLGEDIVLFPGHGGKAAALVDRCPHRGTKLSRGRILFPGTLSCGYHGWTYNAQGECVAAIVEGPESRVPGKVRVKAYPTEERFGIVWGFIGEGEPPPLEEDLPPELFEPNIVFQCLFEEWKCDWRNVTENYPDMLHAIFVHRRSPEMVLQKIPAWGNLVVKSLPDGKGLFVQGPGKALQAEYPGLGKFPRQLWWRVFMRRRPGGVGASVRIPGYIVLARRKETYLGFDYTSWQWPMPIEANRTRIMEATITYPKGGLGKVGYGLWWNGYFKYTHRWFFTHQDRRLIESENYRDPETLCSTDVGITIFRRLAAQIAAQRNSGSRPSDGAASSVHERPVQEVS